MRSRIEQGVAQVGDISIAYEDMGNPDDPAALLIMGLGALLTFWQTEFCEPLVAHGYRVVRLDNRDKAENFTRAGQAQPE